MFKPSRLSLVVAIGVASLIIAMLAFIMPQLQDEAYYTSWEQTRTDAREVSWMQEPILHKFKKSLSPQKN